MLFRWNILVQFRHKGTSNKLHFLYIEKVGDKGSIHPSSSFSAEDSNSLICKCASAPKYLRNGLIS